MLAALPCGGSAPKSLCGRGPEVLVEGFRSSDLSDAAALFVRTFNAPPWNDNWSVESAVKRLRDIAETPGSIGVVARDADLVGFALGNLEQSDPTVELNLREMCVTPDRQRAGIGRRLLSALHEVARGAGATRAYLQTARDGDAAAFYLANGYRAAGGQYILVSDEIS